MKNKIVICLILIISLFMTGCRNSRNSDQYYIDLTYVMHKEKFTDSRTRNIDCEVDYPNDDKVVVTCKYEYRYDIIPDSCRFSSYNCVSLGDDWQEKTITEEFTEY